MRLHSVSALQSVRGPLSEKARIEIGSIVLDDHITLRRMVVAVPHAKHIVLPLHGFPETILGWGGLATALASDTEIHAFDWPGCGFSSRPPVSRFGYGPKD